MEHPDAQPIELAVRSLDDPVARSLETELIEETTRRYGARGQAPLDSAQFDPPHGLFVVASIAGKALGCGGLRRRDGRVAELKRMYVAPPARRRGVARTMLEYLESQAVAAGYEEIWLETGTEQPEAIGLYRSAGYGEIPPYGEFRHDARSRCFSRVLETRASQPATGPPKRRVASPSPGDGTPG